MPEDKSLNPESNTTEPQPESTGQTYQVSRGKSAFLLILLTLLYALSYMDRSVMGIMVEPMKADLGLSDSQIGFLQTFFIISVGILLIPLGILVDRWSRRKAIALMAITWSAATFFTGQANRFSTLLLARFLTASGEAGFAPGGVAWLSLTFPERVRSRVLGIFNIGIPLGGALGVILGGMIVEKTGDWRSPFLWFAIPGIILGIMALFLPDYKSISETGPKKSLSKELSEILGLLKIKSYTLGGLGLAFWILIVFALPAWLPALLMREYGLDAGEAGKMVGLIFIMGVVGAPLGGLLSDHWQKKNPRGRYYFVLVTIFFGMLSNLLLLCLLGYDLKIFVMAGMVTTALSVMPVPAFYSITQDVAPPKYRATALAIGGNMVFILGGAWGPVIVGALSDSWGGTAQGLQYALLAILPLGLISIIICFIGAKYYPSDCEGVSNNVLAE
jgi:MFS family permease